MSFMTDNLAKHLGQPVFDRTGLTGDYDFTLKWPPKGERPDEPLTHIDAQTGATTVHISSASLVAAVEDQLGLKLDPQTIPLPVLVIDRAEKPESK